MRLATAFLLLSLVAGPLAGCDESDPQAVRGMIRLAPGTGQRLGASDALFITARAAGQAGGPPLAVVKMVGMTFPAAYSIGQEDVMMPGTWFRGKVEIKAVLRKSGFVSMPATGDLEGRASGAVEPGAQGVDIELGPPK